MLTSRLLADYVYELRADALAPESREAALCCVLDLLAAAAAGHTDPAVAAVRRMVLGQYGGGTAEIWFTGERTSAIGAVFCNSSAASALDLDDGVRLARGHPGAAVIPAALASVAAEATTADELLTAIVAGYEVGVRVAKGLLDYAPSGAWSPYAAVAAAGRLRRTKPGHLAHAFAISAQCAPVLQGKAGLVGSDVKEGIPWGAVTGMNALHLAEAGFTGPEQIFDLAANFASERITRDLGGPALIRGAYFKPYACCRHAHAPLDAFAQLLKRHAIAAGDIAAVEVHTYSGTFNLSNLAEPRTLVDVQYSVPYCLGILALHGAQALLPVDAAIVGDAHVRAFAGKVTLHRDPEIEARFPEQSPARVVVTTARGRFESPVTTPRGDPDAPLSWAELQEKFRVATRRALAPARQQETLQAVDRLRAGELRPLLATLVRA